MQVVAVYEANANNVSKTSRETGVDRKTIIRWFNSKHQLTAAFGKVEARYLQFHRSGWYPKIVEQLFEWIINILTILKRTIKWSDLRNKVNELIQE